MALSFRTLLAIAAISTMPLAAGCSLLTSSGAPSAATARLDAAVSGGHGLPSSPAKARVTLAETGSTLLYNLFGAWASAYHHQFASVTIKTAPTGSGTGIADASAGTADLGASDAFLSSGNLVQNPDLLNIPLAISAQQVNYNLPHVPASTHVRLDGSVLAQMYTGAIRNWDDPAIKALNPGLSLPDLPVRPLHRGEPTGSGDTFLFSSYLSTSDPDWNASIGYGVTVAWPKIPGALAEEANSGMVDGCKATPGCVAYIGISYLSQALDDGLGEAELKNTSGQFLLPTSASLDAAVRTFVSATPPNETISMVSGPAPNGYPIVNYEYAIVAMHQRSAVKARDLKAFLAWAITKGNAADFLDQVRFEPLPGPIVELAEDQIARIR